MTERTFRCRSCSEIQTSPTRTGPLPTLCDTCDPAAAARRVEARAAARQNAVRRKRRNALIDDLLGRFERRDEHPGRRPVTNAVRQLAHAQGHDATRVALVDLAAAALAWAELLSPSADTDLTAAAIAVRNYELETAA